MKLLFNSLKGAAIALFLSGLFTGCESTDGGNVSGSVYYGGYCDDQDIIVTPPDRPEAPPQVEHPIARPPMSAPRPMPSIPSAPRPSFRR